MKNQNPSQRVISYQAALSLRADARSAGDTVILTNGCFDILHRGHLEYLHSSAALGDLLIVAINSDASVRSLKGPSRPVHREQDRAFAVASLRFVDAVFIFEGPRLNNEIANLAPDLYTKAGDYTPETLEKSEVNALHSVGAEIHILPFLGGHSTTNIIEKVSSGVPL